MQKVLLKSFCALLILIACSNKNSAQCTFAIPSNALIISKDTTITSLPFVYTWIWAGVTLNVSCACGGGGPNQPYGSFLLEDGATMINTPNGGGSWNIFMKKNSTVSNGTNPNYCGGSWLVYADHSATFLNNACGLDITYCDSVVFDYSNAPSRPLTTQFSANTTQLCTGNPVTFTDQSTGAPTGWKWTFTGGTPSTSTAQNPTVVYNGSGTFNVKLVVTNANAKDSLTQTGYINVTSKPDAGAIIAPAPICANNTIQLSDTGNTGTIQWQSGTPGNFTNINNANTASYTSLPLTQSIYYRIITTNGICADTSASVMVTVNPLPDIPTLSTSDSLICASDSSTLQVVEVYSSYLWNTGDTTNYAIANAAGDYWLTVTDANNCTAVSAHVQITVYPAQSVSIIVRGDTLTSFGAVSYHWLYNGDTIANAVTPLYVAAQPGVYAVLVTDTNGCITLSSPVTITGITDLAGYANIQLYPNPTSANKVQLVVDNDLIGSRLELYDDNGRMVFQSQIHALKSEIDLNMSKGIYWLKVSSPNTSIIKKLVHL